MHRWNRYEHHVGESEAFGDQSLTHMMQFAFEPGPRRGPDPGQAPRIVQLQWVAVTEHDLMLFL
jgi:hypothetical protein